MSVVSIDGFDRNRLAVSNRNFGVDDVLRGVVGQFGDSFVAPVDIKNSGSAIVGVYFQ